MEGPRYSRLKDYWRARMGGRVQKVSLNIGCSCPNRDGRIGYGGCHYCSNAAFTPHYCHGDAAVEAQLAAGIAFQRQRYPRAVGFLAYLQAYTNSYGDADWLLETYGRILGYPGIVGLVIGTRPDCLEDRVLDWLAARAAAGVPVYVEIGIESLRDATLAAMNRGHGRADSERALARLAAAGIPAGGHFLLGFPGEDWRDFFTPTVAAWLNRMPLHSIKLHPLQVYKGTTMAEWYRRDPERFCFPELGAYLSHLAEWIQWLRVDLHIDRIAGEAPARLVERSGWGLRIDIVNRRFEALLAERNAWQGRYLVGADIGGDCECGMNG